MNNKIHIVTGLHRAGTHTYSEYLRDKYNIPYIEESQISLNDMDVLDKLVHGYVRNVDEWGKLKKPLYRNELLNGFVVQCPFLSHKVIELSEIGKVYWCKRNNLDVVTSMKNGSFDRFSWKIMRAFKKEFPNDKIWPTLEYNGEKDVFNGFVNHYALLLRVKEYFLQTKYKKLVDVVQLEEQTYYNRDQTLTYKKPLKKHEMVGLIL